MATLVYRSLLAALAAVSLLLAACGGGGGSSLATGEQPSQPTQPSNPAAPFTGTATDRGTDFAGAARKEVLSAGEAAGPSFTHSFVSTGQTPTVKVYAVEASAAKTMTPDELMDAAEKVFPAVFPTHATSQVGDASGMTFRYRSYASTDTSLGVVTAGSNLGHVYTLTKGVLTDHGTAAYWTCQFDASRCGPAMASAKLVFKTGESRVAAHATDVPAKETKLVVSFTQTLNCAGVGGEGTVGVLWMKIECAGSDLTFTPGKSGEERWPAGVVNVLSLTGVRSADGAVAPTQTVSFTTRAAGAGAGPKVFVTDFMANGYPSSQNYGPGVTIIDQRGNTQGVKLPGFPESEGWAITQRLAVDPVMGVVYVGGAGIFLYRFDLETGVALTPIALNLPEAPWHIIQGIALQGSEVCLAMGRRDYADYASKGVLECLSRYTGERTYKSAPNHLAASDMVVMDLLAVPGRGTYYAAAYETAAYTLLFTSEGGYLSEDIAKGSKGTVVEIDATTHAVKRTFTVGAGPRSLVYDQTKERLIVANSGDDSFSAIDLASGNVVTHTLSGFGKATSGIGYQHPMHIRIVEGKLWVANYDRALIALSLDTFQETSRISAGSMRKVQFLEYVNGEFYCSEQGTAMEVVNPKTGSTRTLQAGFSPGYLIGYTPPN